MVVVSGWCASTGLAVTVGAGGGIPLEEVDTAGQTRTNVDEGFTATLGVGTYRATGFSFQAGQTGSVIPFLGVPNGTDSYNVVALGGQVDVAGAGLHGGSFGGSNMFSITTNNTVLHGGITNPPGSQNPVFLDNGTGTTTDHDSSPVVLTMVGQTANGFSNANLGRTYAFDITFEPVTLSRVGPGVGIVHETLDTLNGGPRTNVDQTFTLTLDPGVYVVGDWEYGWGRAGSVIPFAALATGADAYQAIALGNQVDLTGTGNSSSPFGRSNTFVLTAPTTIHAGITNPAGSDNPIFLDNNTTATTDHDGSVSPVVLGQAVDGFSNPNLARAYAFALNIDTRPELRVGADIGIPHDAVDTAGGGPRMNVDDSFTITLAPGRYQAADFSFSSGQDGMVTPFLAALVNGSYEVLALGDTVTVPDEIINQTVTFGGDSIFFLEDTTTLFAGITNPAGSDNPIFFDDGSGFTTDHDGSPPMLTGVGQLLPLSDFSNQNLGRTYAFSIGIESIPIPEPGAAVLVLMGLGGLALRRRRA
jgi:hypothetical protein